MLRPSKMTFSRNASRKLLMLNIDAGGVQSRRIIDRMLAAENASPAQQKVAA